MKHDAFKIALIACVITAPSAWCMNKVVEPLPNAMTSLYKTICPAIGNVRKFNRVMGDCRADIGLLSKQDQGTLFSHLNGQINEQRRPCKKNLDDWNGSRGDKCRSDWWFIRSVTSDLNWRGLGIGSAATVFGGVFTNLAIVAILNNYSVNAMENTAFLCGFAIFGYGIYKTARSFGHSKVLQAQVAPYDECNDTVWRFKRDMEVASDLSHS
ncbi:MAG: hypothetical protein WC707_00055 [Candidatus Babeliaceae bacterium]|jgi:hypothetical protein